MMSRFWFMLYNFLLFPLFYGIIKILSLYKKNVRESIKKRKNLWQRLGNSISKRDWQKPLIWFHVASAGEYLQALPVINRCVLKGAECLLTYSSINAHRWLENSDNSKINGLLTTEFLPHDTIRNARRLIGLIQPSRLVWISYDLWPNLVWEAHSQKIPQSLISAIVHSNSPRTKVFFGRSFYKSLYKNLEHILTVSEADSRRILSAIPKHTQVFVMGETRCDSVLENRNDLKIPELPKFFLDGFTFVAGSSWPKDESCIFPGLKEALNKFPDFFVIIAPHEPSEKHLKNIESFFEGFECRRFSYVTRLSPKTRIIFVDTIGVLAGLYSYANMAYVGGAFTTGVHNILEPAVMGATLSFGPKYDNSNDAIEMIKHNLAFRLNNSKEFRNLLFDLIENRERCSKLGKESCEFVEKQAGASDFCIPYLIKNLF